jgi:twitching motility protein PilT
MDITQLLAFVMQNDASDLHLSGGNAPIVRVYGSLKRLKADTLTNEAIRAMLYSIMTDEQRSDFEKNSVCFLDLVSL